MDPASILGAVVPSLISTGIDAAFGGGGGQAPSPQIAAPQVQPKQGLSQLMNVESVGGKPFGFGGTLSSPGQQNQGMNVPVNMPSPQGTYNRSLISGLGSSLVGEIKKQFSKGMGDVVESIGGGQGVGDQGSRRSGCTGPTCGLMSEEMKRKKEQEFLDMLSNMFTKSTNWG